MADNTQYLFGKRFPNRLFVGGLPVQTTAKELAEFFSSYGSVKETKIIFDADGLSKGYGFVTFSGIEDVLRIQEMGTIFFKNKKLNLGPAVKKEGPCIEPETVIVPNAPSKGQYYYPCSNSVQAPATNVYSYYSTSYPSVAVPQQNIYEAQYDVNMAYQPVAQYTANPVQECACVYYYMIDPAGNTVYWLPGTPQGSLIQELQPVQQCAMRRDSCSNSSESEREDFTSVKKKKKSKRMLTRAPRFNKKGPKHEQQRTD